jgi:hypothetical protein
MFTYKLRHPDGTSADPPAITLAVPNMRVGDTIPLRRGEAFRVVGVVAGENPTLIVEKRGLQKADAVTSAQA